MTNCVNNENKPNKLDVKLDLTSYYGGCQDTVIVDRKTPYVDSSLSISFQRTIRVADNGKENDLPPNLGMFPLYESKQFAASLPLDTVAQGGYFFPMHQREAMWVIFKAKSPFLVKIFVGGVNAVSGESAVETQDTVKRRINLLKQGKDVQDYQFVAMPNSSGYTVAAQITGQSRIGGMSFEVTPSKPPFFGTVEGKQGRKITIGVDSSDGAKVYYRLSVEHTFADLAVLVGNRIGKHTEILRLYVGFERMSSDATLKDAEMEDGDIVMVILPQLGGGGGPMAELRMGLAAGGHIRQTIVKDDHQSSIWEPEASVKFNVQIVNSELFQEVTGQEPPATPVTAQTYAAQGLPYYDIYNERPSGIAGAFGGVKSVAQFDKMKHQDIDADRAVKEVEECTYNPVVTLDCTGKLIGFRTVSQMEQELRQELLGYHI